MFHAKVKVFLFNLSFFLQVYFRTHEESDGSSEIRTGFRFEYEAFSYLAKHSSYNLQ